ncbi:zinc finger protein [Aphelenchoides avenae]|nr:zinc finger protein [Aphelenchus avenae]
MAADSRLRGSSGHSKGPPTDAQDDEDSTDDGSEHSYRRYASRKPPRVETSRASDKPHVCGICSHRFRYKCLLKQHCQKLHADAYPCVVCAESFDSFKHLRSHFLQAHTETNEAEAKPYGCICGQSFQFPNQMKLHFESRHACRHECSKCELAFNDHTDLRRHISEQHSKKYACRQEGCSFKHRRKFAIERHVKAAHGENAVPCTIEGCPLRLPYRQIKRHIRERHADQLKRIKPSIPVEKNSAETSDYASGSSSPSTSTAARSSSSSAADVGSVLQPQDLNERDECRTSDEPAATLEGADGVASRVAKRSSPRSSPRKSVEKTEGPPRSSKGSFVCSTCGKVNRSRHDLVRHVARAHEKRYAEKKRTKAHACAFEGCTKSFKTPGELEDHMNAHNGDYKYACEHCSRRFFGRQRFAVHLRKHHAISIRQFSTVAKNLSV